MPRATWASPVPNRNAALPPLSHSAHDAGVVNDRAAVISTNIGAAVRMQGLIAKVLSVDEFSTLMPPTVLEGDRSIAGGLRRPRRVSRLPPVRTPSCVKPEPSCVIDFTAPAQRKFIRRRPGRRLITVV